MNNIENQLNALHQAAANQSPVPANLQGCLDALNNVSSNQSHPAPTLKQLQDALEHARALAKKPLPPYQPGEALDVRMKRAILPLINIHGAKAELLAFELKEQNDKVTKIQEAMTTFARSVGDDGKATITPAIKDALTAVKNLAIKDSKGLPDATLDASITTVINALARNPATCEKIDAEKLRQTLETARDRLKREIDDKKTTMETYQKNFNEMWQIFMKIMQEYNDIVSKAAQNINKNR